MSEKLTWERPSATEIATRPEASAYSGGDVVPPSSAD